MPPFGGPPLGLDMVPGKKNQDQRSQPPVFEQTAIIGRVRDIERRFSDMQTMITFTEEQALKNFNKAWSRIKEVDDKITMLHHSVAEIEKHIHLMINEFKLTAKKEDYDVLKRYIDYIKPTRFVTVEQVERIVNDILGEHDNKPQHEEQEEEA